MFLFAHLEVVTENITVDCYVAASHLLSTYALVREKRASLAASHVIGINLGHEGMTDKPDQSLQYLPVCMWNACIRPRHRRKCSSFEIFLCIPIKLFPRDTS